MAGFRAGALGPICVAVFEGQASVQALRHLESARRTVGERHPLVLNFNVVTGARLAMPERAVTEAAARLQAQFASSSLGALTVIEGRGLAAVVGRTFLAGLALLTPSEASEVYRSIDEAVDSLKSRPERFAQVLTIPDLAAQLDEFAHPNERF